MKRLKILDFYTHQGNQAEFFKLPHDFFLTNPDGSLPQWNVAHRKLPSNVKLMTDSMLKHQDIDIIILRAPVSSKKYEVYLNKGVVPIAAVQTTTPFKIPKQCQNIVWNSYEVMKNYEERFLDKKNYYIVHGFDPNEFQNLELERKSRVLTVANCFKIRGDIMGYPLWVNIFKEIKEMDIVGHGNLDIYKKDRQAKTFEDLIKIYNSYAVFLNTTRESAMPRSRGEALMCGCPIITTDNYDINKYLKHKESAFLSNDKREIIAAINKFFKSKQMQLDYGLKGREAAIKHFHIRDNHEKWENVFSKL